MLRDLDGAVDDEALGLGEDLGDGVVGDFHFFSVGFCSVRIRFSVAEARLAVR
jgi:hypothetical protein